MGAAKNQVHFPTAKTSSSGCVRLTACLTALGLCLAALSTSGQDAGNSPVPSPAPTASGHSSPGGTNSSPATTAKGDIDFNDPRVKAAISEAMDNPISELIIAWNQFDAIQVHFPSTLLYEERDAWAYKYQFIPTFPIPVGERWNWVSRLDLPVVSLPVKEEVGKLFQLDQGGNLGPDGRLPPGLDPFGRTTGLGDIAYVGLVGPKHLPRFGGGRLIFAAGPTLIFPSASTDILGQGKWQAGPSLAAGFISEHWRFGLFPQQWWSFAGDDHRRAVSQLNLQYFLYYAPTPDWEIGMSPNAFVNWNASSGNGLTFPVGLGVHRMFNIGKLPMSVGVEASYAVIHPDDWPGSRWDIRLYVMPFAPAPWGHLAKELKALQ